MSHFKVLSQHLAGGMEMNLIQVLIVQHLVKSSLCCNVIQLAVCICMLLHVKVPLLFADVPRC